MDVCMENRSSFNMFCCYSRSRYLLIFSCFLSENGNMELGGGESEANLTML